MPYYRIRVAAEHGELRAIGSSTLSNGMPVEAYIATDAKTFMSYLFKPLIDQIQRAFRD
jgi:HlyD family secretion protein